MICIKKCEDLYPGIFCLSACCQITQLGGQEHDNYQ